MLLEKAQEQFLAVDWSALNLQKSKQQAKDLMDDWSFQKKVEGFKADIDKMESQPEVIMLMWYAISSGLKFKRRG